MDSTQQFLNEELKKKFHGKTEIPSKYISKYPDSAERDYFRLMNEFAKEALKSPLEAHLPELLQILKEAEINAPTCNQKATRLDGKQAKANAERRAKLRRSQVAEMVVRMKLILDTVKKEMTASVALFGIERRLRAIANKNRKLTIKEWKKAISKTLGINILEDYYDGPFYAQMIEDWVKQNVGLITTLEDECLDRMEKVVLDGYLSGKLVTQITEDIQASYKMTKSHARLIARDQMGKLNCQITKHQQTSCGVKKYNWITCRDDRVRSSHKALDGKTFDWEHPPVVDKNGRRCHPGEDYQCRCIADPVFDLDTLTLPIDGRREAAWN